MDATQYGVGHQRSVADETSDPLHGEPQGADVGALAESMADSHRDAGAGREIAGH